MVSRRGAVVRRREMAYAALNKAGDGPTQTRWGADHNAGATPEVLMALTEENNVSQYMFTVHECARM